MSSDLMGSTRVDDVDEAHLRAMRVAVARDVLMQLDARKIVAESGTYVRLLGDDPNAKNWRGRQEGRSAEPELMDAAREGADLQTVVDKLGSCAVCAIGASLLSYARLFDSVPLTDWNAWRSSGRDTFSISPNGGTDGAKDVLLDKLGVQFVQSIEQVFEGWEPGTTDCKDDVEGYDVGVYGEIGSEERMRTIMHQIIEQGGEFVMPYYEASERVDEDEDDANDDGDDDEEV